MCAIIKNPTTSMPISLAATICCLETSASVTCVAIRTMSAPASRASLRSSTVPIPGKRSTEIFEKSETSFAARINSISFTFDIPYWTEDPPIPSP